MSRPTEMTAAEGVVSARRLASVPFRAPWWATFRRSMSPASPAAASAEASGARIYRTDRSGAITCKLYEDGTLELRGHLTSEDG